MSNVREVAGVRPKAVVTAVQLPDVSDEAFASSLTELERLAKTLGLETIGRVTQRRAGLANVTVLGEGKLHELAAFTGGTGIVPSYSAKTGSDEEEVEQEEEDDAAAESGSQTEQRATVVIVDHDLSPGQMRNLERATSAEVLDRTMVILSIFQRHARTREARMQVEIAQLAYMAPRLREANAGQDRQRGGIGGKGAGETALELDRRRIRDRIADLRRELVQVEREAELRRTRRHQTETSTVALIGYTNAGKSSLMRALTGDSVYVADQLFATLDTTVRVLFPEVRPRILVSDTVGFIKQLPHDLVASFRSTLAEARDADLILHVVDASDPAFRDQLEVTLSVLRDIDAAKQPRKLILNKCDRLELEQQAALVREFPEAVLLSAKDPQQVQRLHALICKHFEDQMQEATFTVPYSAQRNVSLLHERTRVLDERYDEEGAHIKVLAPPAVLGGLQRDFAKS
ncbi:MAG TPA: GTPase HflX [Polyangiales bacterium]|nr:GTPase HflX [Polyangiales bacterium]